MDCSPDVFHEILKLCICTENSSNCILVNGFVKTLTSYNTKGTNAAKTKVQNRLYPSKTPELKKTTNKTYNVDNFMTKLIFKAISSCGYFVKITTKLCPLTCLLKCLKSLVFSTCKSLTLNPQSLSPDH